MRRAEAWLMVLVGAFALFVGVEVVGAPRGHRAPVAAGADSSRAHDVARPSTPASNTAGPGVSSPASDAEITVTQSSTEAPVRDAADVRARIAAATDTYMTDMLADLKGTLVRWPDWRERGLRIWVQSMTGIPDWDLRYAQMARDAFADWSGSGIPMRLDFVLDSASSDIHIVWIDRFPPEDGQRVGSTRRAADQNGWLVRAEIMIAVHDSTARAIPPSALAGIVRHEAGHALGLGHSRNQGTKMYPIELVDDITPMDRATMRLLYELPPGRVN